MPQISIILGTYGQKEILKKVLDSFQEQTLSGTKFEIVVVDSSSPDGTGEFLTSYHPNYQFKAIIQANMGKAAARNRAILEASSPLILITDADMIAHPKLVETHLEAHHAFGKPASFEGLTYNMRRLEWPSSPDNLTAYISKDYSDGSKLGWYYFLTGNISLPKALFEKFKGFDTDFKGYGWEDLELGYRMSQMKIPHFYLKNAINYHYHVITEEEEIRRSVDKGKSAKVFLEKHPELKWFLGCNPLSLFVHKQIKEDGRIYSYLKQNFFDSKTDWKHRFGAWFLKEHHYLTGIRSHV